MIHVSSASHHLRPNFSATPHGETMASQSGRNASHHGVLGQPCQTAERSDGSGFHRQNVPLKPQEPQGVCAVLVMRFWPGVEATKNQDLLEFGTLFCMLTPRKWWGVPKKFTLDFGQLWSHTNTGEGNYN